MRAPAARSWRTAAPTALIVSRGFTWRCWDRFPTTNVRPFRPRRCCCRAGRRSTCIASAPGRGRFWCRCRSCRPASPATELDNRVGHPRVVHQAARRVAAAALSGHKAWHRAVQLGPVLPRSRSRAQACGSGWAGYRCAGEPCAAAEAWMVERFAASDGLGAIFPPMIWSIVALRCLGYADDSPEVRYCHEHLEGLMIEEDGAIRLQPCKSPVWDTAITLRALAAAGVDAGTQPSRRAVSWLLDKEIRRRGDWAENVAAEPGGWCFEYANEFYPDVDDTAMVLMALAGQLEAADAATDLDGELRLIDRAVVAGAGNARERIAVLDQIAAASTGPCVGCWRMQNRDGGWGAFDRDNDHEFLCHVPFADHNAMIDPSTPDLTAGCWRCSVNSAVASATRWSIGRSRTCAARRRPTAVGLAAGASITSTAPGRCWSDGCRRRADGRSGWSVAAPIGCIAYQQPCGGWGESPDSYADPLAARPGTDDRLANGLGRVGAGGRRSARSPGRGPRASGYLIDHAARRRHLGRARVHRHRFSAGVLPAISLVPDLFSADGIGRWKAAVRQKPTRRKRVPAGHVDVASLDFGSTATPLMLGAPPR